MSTWNAQTLLSKVKQLVFDFFRFLDESHPSANAKNKTSALLYRYIFGFITITLALLLNLNLTIFGTTPAMMFILATGLVAWKTSPWVSLVSSIYAALSLEYFFIGPANNIVITFGFAFRLSTFIFVGLLIVYLVSSQKRSQAKIQHLAFHDALTGLANRRLLDEKLRFELVQAKESNSMFAVLFLDVDKFKSINDKYGHEIGDMLLQEVAKRLSTIIRKQDMLARIGGDEFIILLSQIDYYEEVEAFIARIVSIMSEVYDLKDNSFRSTVSIGCSLFPRDGEEILELLRKADSNLYHVKQKRQISIVDNRSILAYKSS